MTKRKFYLTRFEVRRYFIICIFGLSMPSLLFPQCTQPSEEIVLDKTRGYAGNDTYTITIPNSAGMIICVRFLFGGLPSTTSIGPMNSQGAFPIPLPQNSNVGLYTFIAIKNTACGPCSEGTDWKSVAWTNFTVDPPQPATLSFNDQGTVRAGESFTMTVGNGWGVTLDSKYTHNGGSPVTEIGFPPLDSVAFPNGSVPIGVNACTLPGTRVYTALRNTRNTEWVGFSLGIQITPPYGPLVQSVSPSNGLPGSNVPVEIIGLRFCPDISLTANPSSSLTFENVIISDEVHALFKIAPSAPPGTVVVTLSSAGGSVSFNFTVDPPPLPLTLRKEYIYIGGRPRVQG